jgi:hypothetical protein
MIPQFGDDFWFIYDTTTFWLQISVQVYANGKIKDCPRGQSFEFYFSSIMLASSLSQRRPSRASRS